MLEKKTFQLIIVDLLVDDYKFITKDTRTVFQILAEAFKLIICTNLSKSQEFSDPNLYSLGNHTMHYNLLLQKLSVLPTFIY